jgi:hypothetical protein
VAADYAALSGLPWLGLPYTQGVALGYRIPAFQAEAPGIDALLPTAFGGESNVRRFFDLKAELQYGDCDFATDFIHQSSFILHQSATP